MDAIALMDALGIETFSVAGHDWGSNIAEALAISWPNRVHRMVLLSLMPRLGGMPTPSFEQAQRNWYEWFMATAGGTEADRKDSKGAAHIHWVNWAPPGWFDEATFDAVARSFENPDRAGVTLQSYRLRWDEAAPDRRSVWLDARVKATKLLSLPTLYIQGEVDGLNPPSASENVREKFDGPFERVVLPRVGHFPQREAPNIVGQRLIAHFAKGAVS